MRSILFSTIVIAVLLAITVQVNTVYAGVYSNQLTKCMVKSMDKQDKMQILRYMILICSQPPEVQDMVSISEEQERKILKNTAKLYSYLAIDSCKIFAKKALKYEGEKAFQKSFSMLGKIVLQQNLNTKRGQEMIKTFQKYMKYYIKKDMKK